MDFYNSPLVSVIVPCYNHADYILNTVESVLNQTYQNIEVLVSDDASTDSSLAVLKNIKDSRVKLFPFEENHGIVYALNYLIEQAKGDYIATLGSDDLFTPNKIEKQLRTFEAHPDLGAVFTLAKIIDEDGNEYPDSPLAQIFTEQNRTRAEWLRYFFETGNHLCHSSALIRRSVQEEIGPYRASFRQLQDFDLWVRVLTHYPIEVIQEELTHYRRSRSSKSSMSASTEANDLRVANEYGLCFLDFFRNIPQDLFYSSFGDLCEADFPLYKADFAFARYHVLSQLNLGGNEFVFPSSVFFLDSCGKKMLDSNCPDIISYYYQKNAKEAVKYHLLKVKQFAREQEFHSQLQAQERLNQDLHARNQDLRARNQDLHAQLDSLYHSKSWRITKPLRSITSITRKLLGV